MGKNGAALLGLVPAAVDARGHFFSGADAPRLFARFTATAGRFRLAAPLLACAMATEERSGAARFLAELARAIDAVIDPVDGVPLVTGDDLMRALRLERGRVVGRLLERVREERIAGTIQTKKQALVFAKRALAEERTR
ncbi:MAG: hypothetical protein M5R36_28175 [Deltaproteobacteria bacterium]|nr:hypothetical protein [Deltaproteobacteria bacterium]